MMQYNLNVQRQIFDEATVLTIGYVGSRGLNLFTMYDYNSPVPTIDANGVYHWATLQNGQIVQNPRINPAFGGLEMRAPNGSSKYNSLQASLNRRFSRNVQGQVSYTYSKSLDDGSVSYGIEASMVLLRRSKTHISRSSTGDAPTSISRRTSGPAP
jgi:hypothetical protein